MSYALGESRRDVKYLVEVTSLCACSGLTERNRRLVWWHSAEKSRLRINSSVVRSKIAQQ